MSLRIRNFHLLGIASVHVCALAWHHRFMVVVIGMLFSFDSTGPFKITFYINIKAYSSLAPLFHSHGYVNIVSFDPQVVFAWLLNHTKTTNIISDNFFGYQFPISRASKAPCP